MKDKTNCAHAKEALLEEIQEGMSAEGLDIFIEKHLECKEDLLEFYQTIELLNDIEKERPSEKMDTNFYALLAKETEQMSSLKVSHKSNWIKNFAVAASIFIVGALSGFYLLQPGSESKFVAENLDEDKNMILASNSSIHRLNDIAEMRKAPALNDKIIDALNHALTRDPNVNVRLSAIEAMLHYADNPKVRENLIKAIPYQDSPIIQLTLAEVMINLEAGNSKEEWEKLFKSEKLEEDVKSQLRETLAPVLKI